MWQDQSTCDFRTGLARNTSESLFAPTLRAAGSVLLLMAAVSVSKLQLTWGGELFCGVDSLILENYFQNSPSVFIAL